MKVKNVIYIMEDLLGILKHYENRNIEDMLKDIKDKLLEEEPKAIVTVENVDETNEDYTEIIAKLEKMPKDEQLNYLSRYKKAELIKIAAAIDMKLQSRDKKDILIQTIANHFSYIQLNEQMSKRPKQTIR